MNRRYSLLILLVLGAVTVWTLRQQILPAVARCLDVGTPPRRVDCVFILPGDQQVRPFVAAALVNAGFADIAIFPENAPSPDVLEGLHPASSETIRHVLECRGLADTQIVLLKGATETSAQDLQTLRQYLQKRSEIQVAIVTSDYHTRRVRWLAQRVLQDDANRVCYVSAPVDGFTANDWWRTPTGFSTITSEYLKLGFVAMQSRLLRWTAVGLAILLASGVYLIARQRRYVLREGNS